MDTIIPEQTPTVDISEDIASFIEFSKAKPILNELIDNWKDEVTKTENRRIERDIEFDVEQLRAAGEIDPDETIIPRRVIDANIKREMPTSIAYIKQSRRIATFKCVEDPAVNTQRLETEFTEGMRYTKWEVPHYKVLDGAKTHGWDAVEVLYDDSKPLHVAVEHIGHERLIFARDALDIQHQDRIIRWYTATPFRLKQLSIKYGFNPSVVADVLAKKKDKKQQDLLNIYKCYYKLQDIVYVAWFMIEEGAKDWLLAPKPFFNGRKVEQEQEPILGIDPITNMPAMMEQPSIFVDAPETQYPIFLLPYNETEKQKIFDHKGRVFYDGPDQEAQTAVLSGYINGLTRAAGIYGSPRQDTDDSASVKQLDIDLTPGTILSKPMDFFNMPYPDPSTLQALNYLGSANAQEAGQVDFAAQNRKDSRKTATEVEKASQQQGLLKSVDVTMYSTFIREVYSYAWLIVQSQAVVGYIDFLLIPAGQEMEMGMGMETEYVNDIEKIELLYDIRAAGDTDVIERAEKIQSMMADWPVISMTPLRDRFLADLMRLKYPDDGETYANILVQGDVKRNLIGALGSMVKALVTPEDVAALPPEKQQELAALEQQTQAVLTNPNI